MVDAVRGQAVVVEIFIVAELHPFVAGFYIIKVSVQCRYNHFLIMFP